MTQATLLSTPSHSYSDGPRCDMVDCSRVADKEPLTVEIEGKESITVPVCSTHLRYFIKGGNFAVCMAITEGQFKSIPKDFLHV